MKLKNLFFILLILIFGSLIAYRMTQNSENDSKGKNKKDTKQKTAVNGEIVTSQDFTNHLSLSGSIEANEQIEIRSEVSGIIENIAFSEGTQVSKGQLLFKVNDVELRAQLAQAQTKQKLASENERRAKLLLQKEAISQEEYDIASADYRTTQAQTQLISAQIAKTSVRAPFSGKIGLRSISPGTYVTPATLIAKLVSTNPIKITFSIPEKYVSELKPNTILSFTISNSNETFSAKVYAIEPAIDVNTRTLQVRAIAENKNGKLLPGTYANVELPLQIIKDAILVPSEAVIPIQNGKKVFISENGKAKEVTIQTATRTDSSLLVLEGLKVGDTLITSGIMSLKNDSPVKVKVINK